MTEIEVQQLIATHFPDEHVHTEGDGYHFMTTIVSTKFEGLNKVKRQQMVYASVNEQIASGEIHALSIKTYTPAEWQALPKENDQ